MMKLFIALCALGMAVANPPGGDFFDPKFDHFDADRYINDDNHLQKFARCFLDDEPCDPDDGDFKVILPEVIQTGCGRCSPHQKPIIRKLLVAVKEKHPDQWDRLRKQHDPEGKHFDALDGFLNAHD